MFEFFDKTEILACANEYEAIPFANSFSIPKFIRRREESTLKKNKDPSHPVEKTKGLARNATGLQILRTRISKI